MPSSDMDLSLTCKSYESLRFLNAGCWLLLLNAGRHLSQWPAHLVGTELGPWKGGGVEGMLSCLGIILERSLNLAGQPCESVHSVTTQ